MNRQLDETRAPKLNDRIDADGLRIAFDLWNERKHIRRRVDTYELIDRSMVNHRTTIDLECSLSFGFQSPAERPSEVAADPVRQMRDCKLRRLFCRSVHVTQDDPKLPAPAADRTAVTVPLFLLRKARFLDVDCHDPQGRVLALARRSTNQQMSARIVAGGILRDAAAQEKSITCADAYQIAYAYVTAKDTRNPAEINEDDYAYADLRRGLDERGIRVISRQLKNTLSVFSDFYIQSIIIPLPISGTEIIKIRVLKDISRHATPRPKALRRLTEPLGIQAARISLSYHDHHPLHTRFSAPADTILDDLAITRLGEKTPYQDPKLNTLVHHAKEAILDRGIAWDTYHLVIKLNPKRGSFLFQHWQPSFYCAHSQASR